MDNGELIELFYNRTYERFVNKQILDDKNYIVPRQQLTNYVHELVNIPFINFIEYIRNNPSEQEIEASDITQFSSFSSCEIEMCNALIWANNPGCQYVDIGRFFPESVASSTEGAYRKYGENHIKAASQLGLVFEYYDYWYLSCLGYIYPDLNTRVRRQILARTILRNLLYQRMLLDVMNHNIRPESYMEMLSDITIKRRINNVCTFLNLCIEECKEENIKVFCIVREKAKERTDIINRYSTNDISSNNQRFLSDLSTNLSYSIFNNRKLFKKYKEGDKKAYQEIVLRHQRLVAIIARLYEKKGYILDDLIQEGNIGLIKAIQHFDYFRKVPFTEYAKSWIFQSISDAIAKQTFIVRLPLNQLSNYRKVKTYIHKFEQQNGYLPSITDIEEELFLDANLIAYLYQLPPDLKELTCLMDDMDCFECKDSDIDNFIEKDYNTFFARNLMRILSKREFRIIKDYYGIGTGKKGDSLSEIGKRYYLTRERVRQIVAKSLKKMRESSIKNKIEDDTLEDIAESIEHLAHINAIINRRKFSQTSSEGHPNNRINKQIFEDDQITSGVVTPKTEERREVEEMNSIKVGDVILYRDKLCSVTKIIIVGDTSRLGIEYENGVLDTIQNDKSKYKILQHSTKSKDTRKEVKELRTSQTKKYNIERKIEFPFLPLQFPQEEKKEKNNSDLYEYYTNKISKMKQAVVKGEKILAKPALLLAIIDGIKDNNIQYNDFILTKWLEEKYNIILARYSSSRHLSNLTGIEMPFWHLQSEGFWHLKCSEIIQRRDYSPTKKWIKENVAYAKLDDDLWFLLQDEEWRNKVRDYIINHKLSHKDDSPIRKVQLGAPEEQLRNREKSQSQYLLSTSLSDLVKQKILTKKQLKHCHKKRLWTIGDVKQIIEKYHLTPDSTRFTKYTLDMWFSIIDLLKKNEDGIEHVYVDIPSAAPYTETELPTLGTDDTEVEE